MKVTVIEIKTYLIKKYLKEIKTYFRDVIIDFGKSGTWKVQLAIAINFISSKDVDEKHVMHSKSKSAEFMTYDNANDVVDELLELLLSKY